MNKENNKNKVIHYVSLNGIGGVQIGFVNLIHKLNKYLKYQHNVYIPREKDKEYTLNFNYKILKYNIINIIRFIIDIKSKKNIFIIQNGLNSKKIYYFLKLVRPANPIFVERGSLWDVQKGEETVYFKNLNYTKLVISNSDATKYYLNKRFKYPMDKIKKIYYSHEKNIINNENNTCIRNISNKENFTVGYIGRIEALKGINCLIETIKMNSVIKYKFAGTGKLFEYLKNNIGHLNNVELLGRVIDIKSYILSCDVIVVPSIREPFGRVILEAGIIGKPVIASYVDGIPEVMGFNNDLLIKPTIELNKHVFKLSHCKIPPYIFCPISNKLVKPKELDPKILLKKILYLKKNRSICIENGKSLKSYVINKFNSNIEINNWHNLFDSYFNERK